MSLNERVVMVPTKQVRPDPNNAKVHTDANLGHIKSSIERFGFIDPIGVVEHPDPDVTGYLVVEGHGRLEAAKALKLTKVPVIVLSLDEAARRGYAIAHNQIQQITGMDMSAVAGEFGRLGVSDDDYMSLGFSDEDVLFLPHTDHQLGSNAVTGASGDQFSRPDGGDYEEQDAPASKGGGFAPMAVHRTSLRFASDLSYNRFLHMLGLVRTRHPAAASIGERLQLLLTDIGYKGEAASHAND